MLRVVAESTQRCEQCGEPLPRLARNIFKKNEGCCPRCLFLIREIGLEFDQIEIRNMATRGRGSVVVPRVEFHRPGKQPGNAIPA